MTFKELKEKISQMIMVGFKEAELAEGSPILQAIRMDSPGKADPLKLRVPPIVV